MGKTSFLILGTQNLDQPWTEPCKPVANGGNIGLPLARNTLLLYF